MANLSAAFAGAGQGLDQLAGAEMQREMMQAQMMRAENLAMLRNYLTTHRDLIVTQARGNVLKDVSDSRVAAQHSARDEEIDRQEAGRAANERSQQGRSLSDTEALQNNEFTNRLELQGRAGRTQQYRDAMTQAFQARTQKAQIRTWLTNYQKQNAMFSANPGGGIDSAGLAQAAQHDSVLASQLQAYKDADSREQAAQSSMNGMGSPYVTMPSGSSAPGALNSSPALMPYDNEEGPGVSDEPYPSDSGAADEIGVSGGAGGSGAGAEADDDAGAGDEDQ